MTMARGGLNAIKGGLPWAQTTTLFGLARGDQGSACQVTSVFCVSLQHSRVLELCVLHVMVASSIPL